MDAAILDWLNLLLRFVHVITAIAWIGASLYFIWLDLSLETPSAAKLQRGLKGELWAIHGGGIYEVGKYQLSPPTMPTTLHWFKWEAYSTWLSGSALLITYFYLRSSTQLVAADTWLQDPGIAIAASVGFLLGGLAIYQVFMRLMPNAGAAAQALALLLLLTSASWLAFHLFAARAAILHVGAMLATIMAANVLMTIMPAQRALVSAIEQGQTPDPAPAIDAKRRSTHNNYLTLPVLFCMLSNHSAFVFSHPHAWALVVAIAITSMVARHFFNAKHSGNLQPAYLVGAGISFVVIAVVAGATSNTRIATVAGVSASEVQPLVTKHCAGCHAEQPTQPGFTTAPGGHLFRTPQDLKANAELVASSLVTNYMPLGNLTGLSDAERATLVSWVTPQP